MAFTSLRSSSSMPSSSAMRKTTCITPVWVSFSPSIRLSSSGPISLTVVRTGWPFSPYTSQNVTGQARKGKWLTPHFSSRASMLSLPSPGLHSPARSPFTSAMNTGTPSWEKPSASTCSVTVLPVPVAPAIRPWRLAMPGSRQTAPSPDVPSQIFPSRIMGISSLFCGSPAFVCFLPYTR